MKTENIIAETFGLFDDRGTKNLFGSHAFRTAIYILYPMGKILQNHISNGRNSVKNLIYPIQFSGPGVLDVGRYQRHLFLMLFAHFGVAPFPFLLLFQWVEIFCNKKEGDMSTSKMRFL
jgi:hypothetical protein